MTKKNLTLCVAELVNMLEEYGASVETLKGVLIYHGFPKDMVADWFSGYETEDK